MRNQIKVAYQEAPEGLHAQVATILENVDKHSRYDSKGIYSAHNIVFGLNEPASTCSTCLRNRVRELRAWAEGGEQVAELTDEQAAEIVKNLLTANGVNTSQDPETLEQAKGYLELTTRLGLEATSPKVKGVFKHITEEFHKLIDSWPADDVVAELELVDETIINFTTADKAPFADGVKGTVLWIDDTAVAAGTYEVKSGGKVVVDKKGKAVFNA